MCVIDMKGAIRQRFDVGNLVEGEHEVEADLSSFPPGLYFVELRSGTTLIAVSSVLNF